MQHDLGQPNRLSSLLVRRFGNTAARICLLVALLGTIVASTANAQDAQIIGAGPPVRRDVATLQIRQLNNLRPVASGEVSEMGINKPAEPNLPLNESVPHPRKSIGNAAESGVTLVFILDNTIRDAGLRGAGTAVGDAVSGMMDTTRGDAVGVAIVDKESSGGALYLPPSKDPNEVRAFIKANFNGEGTQSPIMTTTRSVVEKLANDLRLPPRREIVLVSDGADENCQSETDRIACLERSIETIAASAASGDIPVSVSTIGINSLRAQSNVDRRWLTGLEVLAKRLHGISTTIDPNKPSDLSKEVRSSFERARSVYLFEISCVTEPPLRDGSVELEARGTSRAETTAVSLKGLHCDTLGALCDRIDACKEASPPPSERRPAADGSGSGSGSSGPAATKVELPKKALTTSQKAAIALGALALALVIFLLVRSSNRKKAAARQELIEAEEREAEQMREALEREAADRVAEQSVDRGATRLDGGGSFDASGFGAAPIQPPTNLEFLRSWVSDTDGPHLAVFSNGRTFSVRAGHSPISIGLDDDGHLLPVGERDASAVVIVSREGGINLSARAARAGLNIIRDLDEAIVESPGPLTFGSVLRIPGAGLIEARLLDPAPGNPYSASSRRPAWNIVPASAELAGIGSRLISNRAVLLGRQPDPKSDTETFDLSQGGTQAAASRVSGQHALLWVSGGFLFVADLGSSNGTFLNGARLPARLPMIVSNGDRLSFSSSVHFFVSES
jgi:hypothetical protein